MSSFDFNEMHKIQLELHDKYKNIWSPLSPEIGKDMLLYMMIEAGEVADILKKEGNKKVMEDKETRAHFIEEMTDVMMYFNDIMLCYGITPKEFEEIYREKHKRNMNRW